MIAFAAILVLQVVEGGVKRLVQEAVEMAVQAIAVVNAMVLAAGLVDMAVQVVVLAETYSQFIDERE